MNKLTFGAAAAALALAVPAAAPAQQLPAAAVGVVDVERVGRTCTPCAAAFQQLQAQGQQVEQRQGQLATPLQAELNAIQTAVNALPAGQQPDATLQQRIVRFQTQQQAAEAEMERASTTLQRNVAFVQQQIAQRLQPAIQQIAQQRGATVIVDRRNALFFSPAIDLTDSVLAIVNQNTAAINVTAPPPPQQPAQQQPRPQGR